MTLPGMNYRLSRSILSCAVPALLVALGGCASTSEKRTPLTVEKTGAELTSRSLTDDGLHQFLVKNLGHEPPSWPVQTWDFETLSWVAFYYDPAMDVARAQWEVARTAVQTAMERPNPSFHLSGNYVTNPGELRPWFPVAFMDFLFETNGKRAKRTEAQRLVSEAARQGVFTSAWQLRSDLRKALITYVMANRRVTIVREQADAQREIAKSLEDQLKAGAISAFDLGTARSALIKAEAAAIDAERQLPIARGALAQALGVPLNALDGLRVDESFMTSQPPLTGEQLLAARDQSLHSRADVLQALANYQSSEASLDLELAKQTSDVHLLPQYQWDPGQRMWTVEVNFELPLFHKINAGPVEEARARVRLAGSQILETQAQVIAAIDTAAATQAAVSDQVGYIQRQQEESARQASMAQARFEAGEVGRGDTLNARLDRALTAQALLDSQSAAAMAAGQLEDALQVPFANLAGVAQNPRDLAKTTTP